MHELGCPFPKPLTAVHVQVRDMSEEQLEIQSCNDITNVPFQIP